MKIKSVLCFFAFISIILSGCSVKQRTIDTTSQIQVLPSEKDEKVLKRKVSIVRFSNETQYAKGLFYDKDNDPLGKQASDILATKLASSGKFLLLERQDIDKILEETEISDVNFQKVGADYLIVGSITEFGRKNIGDVNVFNRKVSQIVEASVSLRLIDVSTGQIIYSEEAKGQAETSTKTTLGLGERADFDATLSDKAISVAITKLVENIINNCMDRPWKSYILSMDNEMIISGGESQGLSIGDKFEVVERGKKVKNPQTGMLIELPGQQVGTIQILSSAGDNADNEISIARVITGSLDKGSLEKYFIREIR